MRKFKIGEYTVIEHSSKMTGIYNEYGVLITSSHSYNKAIKLAKLLRDAYNQGREDGSQ